MKLLIVAATSGEVALFANYLEEKGIGQDDVKVMITGVGPIATAYALTRELCITRYDFIVQAGVGGSFDQGLPLGAVVFIGSDTYGDLGAEDHDQYLDIFDLGLMPENDAVHTAKKMVTPQLPIHEQMSLPVVAGITVSTVSGKDATINFRTRKFGATVESMEGAAFHYVCIKEGMAFAQVRAISNYVVPRDKSTWRMKDAIVNLNQWLIDFVGRIIGQ